LVVWQSLGLPTILESTTKSLFNHAIILATGLAYLFAAPYNELGLKNGRFHLR